MSLDGSAGRSRVSRPAMVAVLLSLGAVLVSATLLVRQNRSDKNEVPTGDALKILNESRTTVGGPFAPGDVIFYASGMFQAKERINLVSARPLKTNGAMEFLTSRVNDLSVDAEARGYVALLCTRRWPPRGFGPTFPLSGTVIEADESFAVTFWVRPKRTQHLEASGIRIVYESAGQRYEQTSDLRSLQLDIDRSRPCDQRPDGWTEPWEGFPSTVDRLP